MCGRLSSRHTRIVRSGFAKSLTMTGVILESYSSSVSLTLIFMTAANTFGPPPPNSTDFSNSGRTFVLRKSSGKSSEISSNSLFPRGYSDIVVPRRITNKTPYPKNCCRSLSFFKPSSSMPSVSLISGVLKKPPLRMPCSRKCATLNLAFGLGLTSRL